MVFDEVQRVAAENVLDKNIRVPLMLHDGSQQLYVGNGGNPLRQRRSVKISSDGDMTFAAQGEKMLDVRQQILGASVTAMVAILDVMGTKIQPDNTAKGNQSFKMLVSQISGMPPHGVRVGMRRDHRASRLLCQR